MRYRQLGKTGLSVSVVGVGTYQLGGEWGRSFTQKDVAAILAAAEELGIDLVDTAECYGDHLAEQLVGSALRGRRQRWIVATKFGHRFHGFQERSRSWAPQEVLRQLEDSLRALGTDYVDIYQFHSPRDEEFFTPGLWELLRRQLEAGKIRHIGISLATSACTADDDSQLRRAPEVPLASAQVVYNRLQPQVEERILPLCGELGLGVLARVPLAQGLLSGKYTSGSRFPRNDVRSRQSPEELEHALRQVRRIEERELPQEVPLAAWSLAWCLRHPAVTCVIPGCKSPEQVRQNARAAELAEEPA